MKPRVNWRPWDDERPWCVTLPDGTYIDAYPTWQAAMDAANAWSMEHYTVSFDLWEGCVHVLHAGQIVGVGMDKQQAIRNAARTLPTGNQTNDRGTP